MSDDKNEPYFRTQLNEFGQKEKVDVTVYYIKMPCREEGCAEVRYLKFQDRAQTAYCKPHARVHRLARRAKAARDRRTKRNMSQE